MLFYKVRFQERILSHSYTKKKKKKIAFRTRYNLFEYAIILFDLFNAFATFQALINKVLRDLINYICVIYLNDILIYFKIQEKH